MIAIETGPELRQADRLPEYLLPVIIPAYFEEGGIADRLHRILSVAPGLQAVGVARGHRG